MPERNERLRALYEAYLEEAAAVERQKGFFAGAFGLKGGPADDPCHDRFAESLRALLEECRQEGAEPQEARALLEQVLAPPPKDSPRSAYWMLLAVHGLTDEAVLRLSAADAEALAARYRKDYPRHRRLPAQDRVLRLLEQRAGK